MPEAAGRRIVAGIGNPDRGDDAVGRIVARLLGEALRLPPPSRCAGPFLSLEIVEHDGEATSLLAMLEGAAAAWLIDACMSGASPGTVHRFDAAAAPLPEAMFAASTHGLGVSAAIGLARALRQLPRRCIVYAIEGVCFDFGAPLSSTVARAAEDVARRVLAEIMV